MAPPYDPAKRAQTLAGRGLDFAEAAVLFAGLTLTIEDARRDKSLSPFRGEGGAASAAKGEGDCPQEKTHAQNRTKFAEFGPG